MSSILDSIRTITRQLYPTGRAFWIPKDGVKDRLHKAIGLVEEQVYNDSISILDSILPDNANFTIDDATDWELRLGMITNLLVSLDDRKAAIIRKMNHPGDIKARQSRDYLENSLRLAGFDVYVYDNLLGQTIEQFLASNPLLIQLGDAQLGDSQLGDIYSFYPNLFNGYQLGDFQLGDVQLGNFSIYQNIVVNNISQPLDTFFDVGLSGPEACFFIGGITAGSFANVDINRLNEFRQTILKLKPTQTVAYLLINYV